MKKLYLSLALLLAISTLLLLPQVTLAAVHHSNTRHQHVQEAYSPGTAYYTLSSIVTAGITAGTIGALQYEGTLTLHINADGTLVGRYVLNANPVSSIFVYGSFQSDGSIHLNLVPGENRFWSGTFYPRSFGTYTGTFSITSLGILLRSGTWAIVPVKDPTRVTAFSVSAFISAGSDQSTPYGGVIILDRSGVGTFRMQDGSVVPVIALITSDTITFTFLWKNFRPIFATGTPSNISNSAGVTIVEYIGTFVGPQPDDTGNWHGYPLPFAP